MKAGAIRMCGAVYYFASGHTSRSRNALASLVSPLVAVFIPIVRRDLSYFPSLTAKDRRILYAAYAYQVLRMRARGAQRDNASRRSRSRIGPHAWPPMQTLQPGGGVHAGRSCHRAPTRHLSGEEEMPAETPPPCKHGPNCTRTGDPIGTVAYTPRYRNKILSPAARYVKEGRRYRELVARQEARKAMATHRRGSRGA